ncbi:hypothetical protein [Streptomyces sp. NBC_01358]|uniref:hypothetical protein n=1 Tax=Streptomyces sp. NBC_01358 TaxID=2903837 RepID=UPI002E374AB4|nr:hypothetical protein [Streptomyces sp. NBC_01358]
MARHEAPPRSTPGDDEDIALLSPLKHRNLNLLGRYSFTASAPAVGRCTRCALQRAGARRG